MRANLSSVLTGLADFTGFDLPNEKMEVRKREIIMRKRDALWGKCP